MRSHLTAFGIGAGLALLGVGAIVIAGPRFIDVDAEEGVSISNVSNGSSGSFQISEEGVKFSAKWRGEFAFKPDGRALQRLDESLEIERREGADTARVVYQLSDGAIKATVYRDGKEAPTGADADREAGDLLQRFARSSGVQAEERLKAIIAEGGKAAALAEIEALTSGHAVASYIEALAATVRLTDADVALLAGRAAKLESDYSKRVALAALLGGEGLSGAAVADIVKAAETIEGDHELRLIVEALAEKKAASAALAAAPALIARIEGDHETRLAVTALLESEGVAGADAAKALETAVGKLQSDHELRLIVEAATEKVNDPVVAAAAVGAVGAIDSAHDRRLAIEALAEALPEASEQWLALIKLAGAVDGDHDRRLAIETLAEKAPKTDAIAAALKQAAESIGSDHDRRLALEALE